MNENNENNYGFSEDNSREIYLSEEDVRIADHGYHEMPSQDPEPKKKRGGGVKKAVKLVVSAAVFGLVAGVTMIGVNVVKDTFFPSNIAKIGVTTASTENLENDKNNTKDGSTSTTSNLTKAAITATDVSGVVDQVMPSVVSITSKIKSNNYYYGPTESEGAGSGFIIAKDDKNLYIATNNHVVAGANSLTVGFTDDTTCAATTVGTDADADLAVISVKAEDISDETAKNIKVAVLGDSDSLKVGESVIAIGNALGYGQSVTTGVISAKNREVSFTDGAMILLQTDAAINPGNSGGVLCNSKGEVIGINNAKLADTEVEGMGYAIPMSTAQGILTDLMNATTVKEGDKAYLGIVGKNIDTTYSQALNMPSGIYISQVVSGSPAEKAGLCAGDVITAIDDNNVSTMTGLKEKISRKAAGTKVTVTVKRSNQNGEYEEQKIEVTLGKKSDFENANTDIENNQQNQDSQQGNGGYYDNGSENGQYIDPFEFFFGNGRGNGNGYYYYGR